MIGHVRHNFEIDMKGGQEGCERDSAMGSEVKQVFVIAHSGKDLPIQTTLTSASRNHLLAFTCG
jgi:hypothetical protein